MYATGAPWDLAALPMRLTPDVLEAAAAAYDQLEFHEAPKAPPWRALRLAINARLGRDISYELVKLAVAAHLRRRRLS